MTPSLPLFSPMMPYGTGLTPQPVQNTNSLSLLEEQQRQQQQQAASQQQGGMVGGSGQTPQLYHSQISTTTALPGNTPNYTTTPSHPYDPRHACHTGLGELWHRPSVAVSSLAVITFMHLADTFIQSDLVKSGYTFFILFLSVCVP